MSNHHHSRRRDDWRDERDNRSEKRLRSTEKRDLSTGGYAPRHLLYVKKYVDLEEYIVNYRKRKYVELARLSPCEKWELFGSTIMPIYVPLATGETKEQYEERFLQWLASQQLTLAELENDRDDKRERHYRVKFANCNGAREERFIPPSVASKRERSPSNHSNADQLSPRRKKEHYDQGTTTSARKTVEPLASLNLQQEAPTSASASSPRSEQKCLLKPLPADAPAAAATEAHLSCGCVPCLASGMRQLAKRLADLESKILDRRCASTNDTTASSSRVVDLTGDDDAQSPKRRLYPPPPQNVTGTIGESIDDDPIGKKLLQEYKELNDTIVMNEQVLDASAEELAGMPITDITETTRLQDENAELQELIQCEINNRNAALAMVIVYVWRHDQNELQKMITSKTASHVPHIHRASHYKCAKLTSDITEVTEYASKLTSQLDAFRECSEDTNDPKRQATSKRLGEILGNAQTKLEKLYDQRRHEFTTLINFDEALRLLIQSILTQSKSME